MAVRKYVGWRIKSIGKTKAELHMSVSDLKEEDSIEVLFPGCISQKLGVKINGMKVEEIQIPRILHKMKVAKSLRTGKCETGGDIYLTLYKKDGEEPWPKKHEWPDNGPTPSEGMEH